MTTVHRPILKYAVRAPSEALGAVTIHVFQNNRVFQISHLPSRLDDYAVKPVSYLELSSAKHDHVLGEMQSPIFSILIQGLNDLVQSFHLNPLAGLEI